VRGRDRIQAARDQNHRFWSEGRDAIDLDAIDPTILRRFHGTHPAVIRDWLPEGNDLFQPSSPRPPGRRDRKHRRMLAVEGRTGLDLTKKHYRPAHGPVWSIYQRPDALVRPENDAVVCVDSRLDLPR
jgi:hypothetical protein